MGPSEKSSTLPLNAPVAPFVPPPPATTSVDIVAAEDSTAEDHAPSRQSLLMRAAQRGPQLSFDNIHMASTDPVLAQKTQPRVAERRARFRTVVKLALGACAGLCLIGTAATALSSSGPTAPAVKHESASAHGAAPAAAIVPKETLVFPTTTKAEKTASPVAATPAAAPPARSRSAKRR